MPSPADQLAIKVLGSLEVWRDGQLVPITAPRHRTILAMLVAQPNRIVPLDRLIAALWDEEPPRTARAQIHICISALRQALGDRDSIVTHPSGYATRLADDAVDCRIFEHLLDEVRTIDTDANPDTALGLLDEALGLWRGPAFHGVPGLMIEAMGALLEQRRLVAIEERVEIQLRLGRENASELAELCGEHPLRERLHAFLMVSLYRSGRQAEALAVYRNVRRLLVEELGIEPGTELQAVEQAILNHDATLDLSRIRGPGTNRIVLVPHQLPAAPADFTGREPDVEWLVSHVRGTGPDPTGMPICLITGMGGIGKSALGIHVSHRVADSFPDGQLFARLDGTTSHGIAPADVLDRFLRSLGVEARDIPADVDRRSDTLRGLLAGKRVLIVLDDAASEDQVTPLLPGVPGCAVVITSRRRLAGIPGMRQLELTSLREHDARELLGRIASGRVLDDDPAAAMEIVNLCAGLPLAVRIAGSKLASHPHWGAADLVRRLAGERQRLDQLVHGGVGVRALLAVAYDMLTPPARRLFRLLSLLDVPDCGEWAVAAAAGLPGLDAGPLLDELIESRLLDVDVRIPGRARYRYHDLVRLYALEQATAEETPREQEAAVDRVLGACLALAREAHRRTYGGDYVTLGAPMDDPYEHLVDVRELLPEPFTWFEDERSTLVSLVSQAAQGRVEYAWNLAIGSVVFFEALGCFDDWKTTHELALAATHRAGHLRGEAALLCSLGSLGFARGDGTVSGGLHRALALFEELDDALGQALTLRNLAHFDRVHGSYDSAIVRYRGALEGFRLAGDPVGEAHALSGLAQAYLEVQDASSAELYSYESLSLARRTNNRRLEAQAMYRLGEVLTAKGEYGTAKQHLTQALALVKANGDRVGQAYVLTAIAGVHVELDELTAAEGILDDPLLSERLNDRHIRGRAILIRAQVVQKRGHLAQAEALILAAVDIFSEKGGAVWHGRALKAMSDLRRKVATG